MNFTTFKIILALLIGFLIGFIMCDYARPNNVDGVYISHNAICYNFKAHNAELTKAHEEVHGLILTDSPSCKDGCYKHFCG